MNALVLKNFSGLPEIIPSFWEAKRFALDAAAKITSVTSESELHIAVDALRALRELSKGMENGRKFAKAPILELGKKIDSTASVALVGVEKAENLITGLINHFQRKQFEAQRAEEERSRREQAEAQRLVDEAKRKREEAERVNSEALKQEAAKLEEKALDATMATELTGAAVVIQKPKGLVVKSRLNFQVLDAIIFCQAYPQFFSWNAETEVLKLKRREILEELNREDGKGIFHATKFPEELPDAKGSRVVKPIGLRVFEETKSHVR